MGGQPATADNCEQWADTHGITFPILADPNWGHSNKYEQDFGIPTFHLLGRDMTIRMLDAYPSPSDIQEALDEEIPEVEWDEPPALEDVEPVQQPVDPEAGSPLTGGTETPFGGCSANQAGDTPSGLWALLGVLGLAIRRRLS